MRGSEFGRRRFLRSTAAGVIGVAGGMAATGAVAADSQASGDVTVLSASNSWSYEVATRRPFGEKDPVEKRAKANSGDEILESGASVDGHVLQGGEDTYWFPDVITRIVATPDGGNSSLDVNVGSTKFGAWIRMDAYGNGFDYYISYDGERSEITEGPLTEGGDSASVDSASGFVNGDNSDNYQVVGYLDDIIIADPYSSGIAGLEVRFNPD